MNYKAFIRSEETSFSLRFDYILATLPVTIWAVLWFGFSALLIIALSCAASFVTDMIIRSVKERKFKRPSLYSLFCGIIFSFMLYDGTPYYFVIIGAVLVSILVNIFESEGKSLFFVPVAVRVILYGLFGDFLTVPEDMPYEALILRRIPAQTTFECSLGAMEGAIGVVSAIALIFSAIYLAVRKNADFTVSAAYVLSSAVLFFVFPCIQGSNLNSAIFELLTSGIIFISVFILTDFSLHRYKVVPKIVIGALCGALTFAFRLFGYDHQAIYIAYLVIVFFSFIAIKFASAGKGKYEK